MSDLPETWLGDCDAEIRDAYARGRAEAAAEIARLREALRSVINHWDEFGPECGLDETIYHARAALGGKP